MDGRKELLTYMGSAAVTIAVLFTAQIWYASYLDVSHYAEWTGAPMNAELKAVREQEAQALSSGKLPIDKAIDALASRGRRGFPTIAPAPSSDLGAMSGWIHRPNFAAYQPRKPAGAPAATQESLPEGAQAQPAEGEPQDGQAAGGAQASTEGQTPSVAQGADEAQAGQPQATGAAAPAPAQGEASPSSKSAPAQQAQQGAQPTAEQPAGDAPKGQK